MGNNRKLPNFKIDRADSRNLVCQVADGLRSAIMTGFYRQGYVLPSRTQLSEALGVSPRVTREALRKLADEGLACPRKRLGSVVLPKGSAVWKGSVLFIWHEKQETNYFATRFISTLRHTLVSSGYLFSAIAIGENSDGTPELSTLQSSLARRYDIAITFNTPREAINLLAKNNVRVILVNPERKSLRGLLVNIDPLASFDKLIERCRQSGVKNVVVAGFKEGHMRLEPLFKKCGISAGSLCVSIRGNRTTDTLETQVRKAMVATDKRFGKGRKRMPDAIIFTDDFFAMGAILALALNGIRIPEDVKVATISNKGFTPVHPQQLTRIEYDFAEYGKIVADHTIAHLTGRNAPRRIAVSPVFIPGETL